MSDALPDGFTSATADVNGTTLHYVRGGDGPPLVLLHGFPQDWYEWRRVLPRLSRRYDVLAVDLRGVGGSAAPAEGYDAATLAEDVHALVAQLGLAPVHVVGHDIGGMVSYAFARRFPAATRTALVLEVLFVGVVPEAELELTIPLWHGGFHMVPDLPEALVTGREAIYFRYFFDIGTVDRTAITDADLAHYVGAYGDPAHLRAAFEFYRAIPATAEFYAKHTAPTDVPLLLAGSRQVFGPALSVTARRLRADYGWSDVRSEILEEGRHYLPDERPDDVADLIERHATS